MENAQRRRQGLELLLKGLEYVNQLHRKGHSRQKEETRICSDKGMADPTLYQLAFASKLNPPLFRLGFVGVAWGSVLSGLVHYLLQLQEADTTFPL